MKKVFTGLFALLVGLMMTGLLSAQAYNPVGNYARSRATSAGYRAADYGVNKAEKKAYDSIENKDKNKKQKSKKQQSKKKTK